MVAFDPYVDMTLYPTANLNSLSQQTGAKTFNLAFITAEGSNSPIPAWGGYASYAVSTGYLKDQINTLRASGGDAIFGFGGASGTEIAQASTSVSAIQSAYQSVIDTYGATKLNFDIEGAAINDQISNQRRDQALASLQQQYAAKGTNLSITFTLPVLPTGLTNDGITLVQDALKAGVKVDTINVMAMDYGDYAAPPTQATMGTYAIQSAKSTEAQLKTIYQNAGVTLTDSQAWQKIGVTPMIGRNDVSSEIFTVNDATALANFANQVGMGVLSMWSLNRDQAPASGQPTSFASATDSSIVQTPFQFAKTFVAATGGNVPTPTPTPTPAPTPTPSTTPISSGNGTVNYVASTWGGTGFNENVTITNSSSTSSTNWQLTFDSVYDITSLWNGNYTVKKLSSGLYEYTVSNASWNGALAAGSSVSFGFSAISDSGSIVSSVTNSDFKIVNLQFTTASLPTPPPPPSPPVNTTSATGNVNFVGSTWGGTGFNDNVTITNTSNLNATSWQLTFDSVYDITSLWNGNYTVKKLSSGLYEYTVSNASWNGALAAGSSISFGFSAISDNGSIVSNVTNSDFKIVSLKFT